jgi:hypothetical protein
MEIIEYSQNYKIPVIKLFSELWPHLNEKKRLRFFEWRYEGKPYDIKPIIFIAKINNKIIGFRSCLPQLFVYGTKKYFVYSPADTIVHKDYRAQGLFSKLNERCIEAVNNSFPGNSLFLNLSSNYKTTAGNLKQGWERMNWGRCYLFKFSAIGFIMSFFSETISQIPFSEDINKGQYKIIITNELKVEEVVTFIDSLKDYNKFTKIRDHNYFKWYYSYIPESHVFVYYYEQDRLSGFLSVKKISKIQYLIEEYFFRNPNILGLSLKSLRRKIKMPIFRVNTFSQHDKNIFIQNSFLSEQKLCTRIFRKNKDPYLIRPANLLIKETDFYIMQLDVRNIENWQLFQSDIL